MAFESFALTPLGRMFKGLSLATGALGFVVYIRYYASFPKAIRQFTNFYLVLLITSTLSVHFIFKQSMVSGLAANASFVTTGSVHLAYFLMQRYRISKTDLIQQITRLCWLTLGIYAVLYFGNITFTALNASGDEFGIGSLKKGLVTFGSVVFLVKYFRTGRLRYFLFSVLFFSTNEWGDFQRYILFAYILVLLVLVLYNRQKLAGLRMIVISFVIIPILLLAISYTRFGQSAGKKINDALELVEGKNTRLSEASVAARVWEIEYAWKSIQKYPVLGVGRVRGAENKKITGGTYFYVSDIGLIGIMYTFGLLGIALFLKQVHYTYKNLWRKDIFANPYTTEALVFILFILLHTIMTGRSILMPAEFLLLVIMVEAGKVQQLTETNKK